MAFADIVFNENRILFGTVGGPVYKTALVQTNGGKEQRSSVWAYPLSVFHFDDLKILEEDMDYTNDFFHAMGGMEIGFLFRDWADYKTKGRGVLNEGFGNGTATGQTFKKYVAGPIAKFRKISKPVASTVVIKMDGAPVACSLDSTTGVVTFEPNVHEVSAGAPEGGESIRLTVPAHGLAVGDIVSLYFNGTWNPLGGTRKVIGTPSADTIRIGGNASALGAFSSGNASWFPQTHNALTWEGEFNLPVRFDSDSLERSMSSAEVISSGVLGMKAFDLSGLKLVELKL